VEPQGQLYGDGMKGEGPGGFKLIEAGCDVSPVVIMPLLFTVTPIELFEHLFGNSGFRNSRSMRGI